jgi:hypothetical protein
MASTREPCYGFRRQPRATDRGGGRERCDGGERGDRERDADRAFVEAGEAVAGGVDEVVDRVQSGEG